jgi:hypothetical protein
MAGSWTSRMSKRRALLCVILAASVCAPGLSTGISDQEREQAVEMLALAGPSATTVVNPSGPRVDHARQRTVVASPFILVSLHGPASDSRWSATTVENGCPESRWAAKAQSGRSPPVAIS